MEGGVGFASLKKGFKNIPIDTSYVKQKGPVYFLRFEYGLNDNFSLGLGTQYRDQKIVVHPSQTLKHKGLGDIDFTFKGTSEFTSINLRYGTSFFFSLGDAEIIDQTINNYSGRHFFAPYLGFDFEASELTFGFRASYKMPMGDQKRVGTGGVVQNRSGGETVYLEAFSERLLFREGNIGLKLLYSITSDYKVAGNLSEEVPNTLIVSAYGNVLRSDNSEIIYDVGYYTSRKTNTFETEKGVVGYFGYRYKF